MNIAIITMMRKGSKRLPNKCVKLLNGKPLYYYTLDNAIKLKMCLDKSDYGIKTNYYLLHNYNDIQLEKYFEKDQTDKINILNRSEYFAGDIHRTNEEIKFNNINADVYIFLQVTNPVRNVKKMKEWVLQFIKSKAMCGFAAIKYNKFCYNSRYKPINFKQKKRTDNGCKKKSIYIENGNFYIFKKSLLNKKHLLNSNRKIIFEDNILFDIDTIEDFNRLEEFLNE